MNETQAATLPQSVDELIVRAECLRRDGLKDGAFFDKKDCDRFAKAIMDAIGDTHQQMLAQKRIADALQRDLAAKDERIAKLEAFKDAINDGFQEWLETPGEISNYALITAVQDAFIGLEIPTTLKGAK